MFGDALPCSPVKVSADRGVTNSALTFCLLKHWVNADLTALSQRIYLTFILHVCVLVRLLNLLKG